MLHRDFVRLLGQLGQLNAQQRQQVCSVVKELDDTALQNLERVLEPARACPHCQASSAQLRPWGSSHGLARMRCRACGHTCNALSATPLAHLRKREQWLRFCQTLIEGVSVRQAAQCCGVDKNTAFRWRHRFLQATAQHRPASESGIVEADETFFLESYKGQRHLHRPPRKRGGVGAHYERVAVLVVRDRSGQTADYRLEVIDTPHVSAVLAPLIQKDAILCTDGALVYRSVARALGLTHRAINIQRGIHVRDGAFHIQNVNAYDSRLKQWLSRFHGVATKYLENYLGWRRLLERYRQGISPMICLHEAQGRFPLQQLMQT